MDDAWQQTLTVNRFPLVIVRAGGKHYLDLRALARRLRTSFSQLELVVLARVKSNVDIGEFPALRCVAVRRQEVARTLLSRAGILGDVARLGEFRDAWPVANAVLAVREGERIGFPAAALLKRHGFNAEARKAMVGRHEDSKHADLVRGLHTLLIQDGLSLRQASERLDFSAGALSQIARRVYPSWSPSMDQAWRETFGRRAYRPAVSAAGRRKLTPATLLEAHARMRASGTTQKAAAQAVGISPATLSLAIRRQYPAWTPELERAWKASFGKR